MKIAYIFPGQGSQAVSMGMEFIENFDLAKDLIKQADDRLDFKILDVLNSKEMLSQSKFTQVAILFVSSLIHKVFEEKTNIKAELSLGHSLGEFSACVASGAIDVIDAMDLVYNRGKFMQEACDGINAGMMVVLGLDDKTLEDFVENKQNLGLSIYPANYNMDGQLVLAGKKADLESISDELKSIGAKRVMLLDMSVASHCPFLEPASVKLEPLLKKYIKDSFAMPIISNVSEKAYDDKETAIMLLKKQLVSPVRYKQSISSIKNIDLFIEFGNSEVLGRMNKKITEIKTLSIKSIDTLNTTIEFIKGN